MKSSTGMFLAMWGLLLSVPDGAALAQGQGLRCVQEALANRGLNPGTPDGKMGPRTRAAAEQYQKWSASALPELSAATAEEWCTQLATPDRDIALANGWVLVSGEEVRTLFLAATHYWEGANAAGFDYITSDGKVTVTRSRGEPTRDTGMFTVEGDTFCFQLRGGTGNPGCTNRGQLLRKGDIYKMFRSDSGVFIIDVTRFVPGNPEGV